VPGDAAVGPDAAVGVSVEETRPDGDCERVPAEGLEPGAADEGAPAPGAAVDVDDGPFAATPEPLPPPQPVRARAAKAAIDVPVAIRVWSEVT
jgi:hypothetical protein